MITYDAKVDSDFSNWKIQQLRQKSLIINGYGNKVCGAGGAKWFVTSPRVKIDMANAVCITMTFLVDYPKGEPSLNIFVAQTPSGQPFKMQYESIYKTRLNSYNTTVTNTVIRTNVYLNIGIALVDLVSGPPSECVTISRATVSYFKCPSKTLKMATFPDVIAPGGDTDAKGKGQCIPNTVPITSGGAWLYCDKTGSIAKVYGCECKPGFEKAANTCTGMQN